MSCFILRTVCIALSFARPYSFYKLLEKQKRDNILLAPAYRQLFMGRMKMLLVDKLFSYGVNNTVNTQEDIIFKPLLQSQVTLATGK